MQEAPASLEPTLAKLLGMVLGGGESTMVVAGAAGIFARLLLNRPGDWPSYFQLYARHVPLPGDTPQAASPGESLMLAFVDKWLTELDCVAQVGALCLGGVIPVLSHPASLPYSLSLPYCPLPLPLPLRSPPPPPPIPAPSLPPSHSLPPPHSLQRRPYITSLPPI